MHHSTSPYSLVCLITVLIFGHRLKFFFRLCKFQKISNSLSYRLCENVDQFRLFLEWLGILSLLGILEQGVKTAMIGGGALRGICGWHITETSKVWPYIKYSYHGLWFLEAVAFLKLQGYYCNWQIKWPLLFFVIGILSLAFINLFGQ